MPDYPFTVFSFLGVLLCIEPAYFNWRVPGRPWSARIFVGWVFIYNLLSFIDSIVWASETLADWPDGNGYCDIGARIKTAFPIGVLGSTICLCLFLINSTNLAPSQKDMGPSNGVRRNMFDMFLGMVLPVIFVVLHYIVEPTQYGILGVAGCQSTTDTAWPTIILYSIWPTLMTFIALILFGTSYHYLSNITAIFLHRLSLRRGQLHENWGIDMPTGISKNGFYRLLITVLFTIAISLPYSLYNLIEFLVSRTNPPSYSWDRIHGSWSIIVKISSPSAPWLSWIAIVLSGTAILFLALNSSDIRKSIKIRIERRKARRAGHTTGDPKLYIPTIPHLTIVNSIVKRACSRTGMIAMTIRWMLNPFHQVRRRFGLGMRRI
jgi:hypothetical protein